VVEVTGDDENVEEEEEKGGITGNGAKKNPKTHLAGDKSSETSWW
jgi:hypothetical protein